MKKCTICWEIKELVKYNKHTDTKDGRRPDCKSCQKLPKSTRIALRTENFSKVSEKSCTKCKVIKPLSEYHALPKARLKVLSYCKVCQKEKNRVNKKKHGHYLEYQKKRAEQSPEKRAFEYFKSELKKKYDLTFEDYTRIIKEQGNSCYVCKSETSENGKRLHIDHCHSTNKVRGILCRACNHGIGNFKDNVELLQKAIEYLKKNNK